MRMRVASAVLGVFLSMAATGGWGQDAALLDVTLTTATQWTEAPIQVSYRGSIDNQEIVSGKRFAWPTIRVEEARWNKNRKLLLEGYGPAGQLLRGKEYVSDGQATLMIERVRLGDGEMHYEANIVGHEIGFVDFDYFGLALGLRHRECPDERYWELRGLRAEEWWIIPTLERMRGLALTGQLRTESGQTICRFEIPGRDVIDVAFDDPRKILYRASFSEDRKKKLEAWYSGHREVDGMMMPTAIRLDVFGNQASEPHLAGQLVYTMALDVDQLRAGASQMDAGIFTKVSLPNQTHVWDSRTDTSFTFLDDAASREFLAKAGINVQVNERASSYRLGWILSGVGAASILLAWLGYRAFGKRRQTAR